MSKAVSTEALLLVFLPVALGGCTAASWQPRPVPFAEPNTEFVVKRPLTFPEGATRLYFQQGRLVTQRQLSVWEHHCALAIDYALSDDVVISPGSFSVAHTQRRSTVGEWGYGVITYESSFYFSADAWPLYALYCEIWTQQDGYNHRRHLSAQGLAEVLGDWVGVTP
jgi:hypothetical protein